MKLYVHGEKWKACAYHSRWNPFFDAIETKQAPDVVLLEGEVFRRKTELRKKAVDVIEQIPAEGSFSKKQFLKFKRTIKDGFWMTLIKTGVKGRKG